MSGYILKGFVILIDWYYILIDMILECTSSSQKMYCTAQNDIYHVSYQSFLRSVLLGPWTFWSGAFYGNIYLKLSGTIMCHILAVKYLERRKQYWCWRFKIKIKILFFFARGGVAFAVVQMFSVICILKDWQYI